MMLHLSAYTVSPGVNSNLTNVFVINLQYYQGEGSSLKLEYSHTVSHDYYVILSPGTLVLLQEHTTQCKYWVERHIYT